MATIIDADCFIGMALLHEKEMPFIRLRILRHAIEAKHKDVMVDISGDAIQNARYHYEYAFYKEGNKIVRNDKNADVKEYLYNEFHSDMPEEVAKTLETFIKGGEPHG